MPLPMIHLNVAVNFYEDKEIPSSFLLGNIAPDSIHMRKNSKREDKKLTHLNIGNSDSDFDEMRQVYYELIKRNPETNWKWFVKGYFSHLLTDYFWFTGIVVAFEERATKDNLTKDEIKKAYYQDTDQIDFNFYKTKKWTEDVWKKLIEANSFDFEPYLKFDEINFWRLRTIHWFDLLSKEPAIEPKYIAEWMVEDFIKMTAGKLRMIFRDWDLRLTQE